MTDERRQREAMDRGVRSRIAANVLLVSLLAIVAVAFLNYGGWLFSRKHDVRFDLTRDRVLALDEATRSFARSIEDPIEIYLVHGVDDTMRARAKKSAADRSHDTGLVQNYYAPLVEQMAASVGFLVNELLELNTRLVYRSASFDREREQPASWQRRLDIGEDQLRNHVVFVNMRTKVKKAIPIYAFFDVDLGGPDPTLVFRRPRIRGEKVEPFLLHGLRAVVEAEKIKVYVVGGHQERTLATAVSFLGLDRFEVAMLEPRGDRLEIPADARALLVFSPARRWPAADLEALERWVLAGGRLFATQGADCPEDFAALLERGGAALRGVQIGHEVLHERRGGIYKLYGAELLRPEQGPPHPITAPTVAGALPIDLGFCRAYRLLADYDRAGVERRVLLRSSPGATAMPWIFDGQDWRQAPERGSELGDFPLALALAFRNGDGERPGRAVFFGSDEWLTTAGLERRAEIANLDVFINALYWLTDTEKLITGTPRRFRGAQVDLGDGKDRVFQAIVLGLVPGLVLLGGLLVHLMRRR